MDTDTNTNASTICSTGEVLGGGLDGCVATSSFSGTDTTKLPLAGGTLSGDLTINSQKELRLADNDSSNYVALRSNATIGTSYILTLPDGQGGAGEALVNDASGNLSWMNLATSSGLLNGMTATNATVDATNDSIRTAIGKLQGQINNATSGTVTSVSGTAPISVATGTTTPVISISQSNTSTAGYLSSTDWNIFNNKLGNSLADGQIFIGNASSVATGVNLSGDATLANNGVLTIANSAVETIMINNGAVTTSKLAIDAVTSANIDNGTITADDIASEAITSDKLASSIGVWALSGTDLSYNLGNVGIGTTSPSYGLDIFATNSAAGTLAITRVEDTNGGPVLLTSKARGTAGSETAVTTGDNLLYIGMRGWDSNSYEIGATISAKVTSDWSDGVTPTKLQFETHDGTSLATRMVISETGNLGVGTSTPTSKLDVAGTIRAQEICDETGTNCLDISSGFNTGDIEGVTAGTGLIGGGTSGTVTLNVDVGTTANKIVQLDASAKLPVIDGSQLTNLPNPTTSTILTGFATGSDADVTNTDTVETAIEKLQGQIDANDTDIAGKVSTSRNINGYALTTDITLDTGDLAEDGNLYFTQARAIASPLNGFSTSSGTVSASDTLLSAIEKLDGNISANSTDISNITSSQWVTTGTDIYNNTGFVGVGTTAPSYGLDIFSTNSAAGTLGITRVEDTFGGPVLLTSKARGSAGAETAVTTGDNLLYTAMRGWDSNSYEIGATISAKVASDWSDGVTPTKLQFETHDGTSLAPRVVISESGKVGIGNQTPRYKLDMVKSSNPTVQNSLGSCNGESVFFDLNADGNEDNGECLQGIGFNPQAAADNDATSAIMYMANAAVNSTHNSLGAEIRSSPKITDARDPGTLYSSYGFVSSMDPRIDSTVNSGSGGLSGNFAAGFFSTLRKTGNRDITDGTWQRGLSGIRLQYGHYFGLDNSTTTEKSMGIHLKPYVRSGTINKIYDVFIDDAFSEGNYAAAQHWGIYQKSPDTKNFFAGKVGVGTNDPTYMLDVSSVNGSDANLRIRGLSSEATGATADLILDGVGDARILFRDSGVIPNVYAMGFNQDDGTFRIGTRDLEDAWTLLKLDSYGNLYPKGSVLTFQNSTHSGSTNHNKWYKIAERTITAQYGESEGVFMTYFYGGSQHYHGTKIYSVRLKQQDPMTESPTVMVNTISSSGRHFSPETGGNTEIKAIVTQDDINGKKIEVYAHNPFTWSSVRNDMLMGNMTVVSGAVGIETLPTGAQYDLLSDSLHVAISGKVGIGIGTTTPDEELDIQKDQSGTTDLRIKNNNSDGGSRVVLVNNISGGGIQTMSSGFGTANWANKLVMWAGTALDGIVVSTQDNIQFHDSTATPKFHFDTPNGRMGIGTTSPTEKLEVNGCIKHSGGTIGTSCASDKTLKDNIEDIDFDEDLIEKFLSLRPRTYIYKTDYDNIFYGFIAQEVEKVDPSLLGEKNKDGKMTVNYEKIKWLHFKASQENSRQIASLNERLNDEIHVMRKENEALKKQNREIIKQNEQMKSVLCELKPKASFCKK